MISRKALLVGFVGLVFVAGGASTVLESFGTISGTADVRPALSFTEVQATNNDGEYVLLHNDAAQDIAISDITLTGGGDEVETLTSETTDVLESGNYLLIVTQDMNVDSYSGDKEYVKASTEDGGITSSLANEGETLTVMINSNEVNSFSYQGSCDTGEAESPVDGCITPKFEVSAQ